MTQAAEALKDRTAVCGVGLKIGSFPDHTALQLAVETFQMALDDAGMQRKDVDGVMLLSMGPAEDSSCQRPPRLNAVP